MNRIRAWWQWWLGFGKIDSRKWADTRQKILDIIDAPVKFDVTPYYYKVTSGNKTWYWNRDTGEFDGTSWEIKPSI